jgi:aminobenzoyl-glutamate utilization protein B
MNKVAERVALVGVAVLVMAGTFHGQQPAKKQDAIATIDKQKDALIRMSDQIWEFAETALRETRSSKLLADYAESQGFRVERGVAGMPTAFIATYGEGKPIIGILGEYDALPGISQKPQPTKEAFAAGAPGHGCGHNMFGAASLGAAIAIKELIAAGKLRGTIRFYGTPAEESVSGKAYMARAGMFNDLDAAVVWHPSDEIRADTESSQAIVDVNVEFHGKAAHAAFDPWNGRSAVDGAELFTHGLNMLREHVRPTVRIHYAILKGGDVPNVVPEYAKVWTWVRDSKRTGVEEVMKRVREIAAGAGMMAGVESKVTVQTGSYEILVNMTGARLLHSNLTWLGPIAYTPEEIEFARSIQRNTEKETKGLKGDVQPIKDPQPPHPEGGSTDVGDVSWITPVIHLSVTTAPAETPWHSWPVVASGRMSIGHKGMLYAAKAMAITMVDLFEDPSKREAIRAEFREKTKGQVYKAYIPDGPPPVPKD